VPAVDHGVVLLTGEQAWNLPIDYVARGGAASDHHPDNDHYHWKNARHCCR
jgi:hypothetical protein